MVPLTQVHSFSDSSDLVATCASDLVQYLETLPSTRQGLPRLVLTGGRLGQALVSALALPDSGFNSSSVWVAWGDERLVPMSSADSNTGEALRRFPELGGLNHYRFPISDDLIHCRDLADAELAAQLSAGQPGPLFDLVLLGIGEDGHVASLFPGHPNPEAGAEGLVAATANSPKPPARRLTLTAEALNRSRAVWFLAAGQEKRQAVAGSLDPGSSIPAARVRGLEETKWYLDSAATPLTVEGG